MQIGLAVGLRKLRSVIPLLQLIPFSPSERFFPRHLIVNANEVKWIKNASVISTWPTRRAAKRAFQCAVTWWKLNWGALCLKSERFSFARLRNVWASCTRTFVSDNGQQKSVRDKNVFLTNTEGRLVNGDYGHSWLATVRVVCRPLVSVKEAFLLRWLRDKLFLWRTNCVFPEHMVRYTCHL